MRALKAFVRSLVLPLAGFAIVTQCWAEVPVVRVARGFGIGYLPLVIMEERKLIEKHAAAAGVPVKVEWMQFAGAAPMNDALLSGDLHFASTGVPGLALLWAKTKGNLEVRGVCSMSAMPVFLNTRNPNIKTLKDFTDKDRIAVPSIKVSTQAVTLQMAAEQVFGEGQANRLDPITIGRSNPDGMAELLSPNGDITAHFTSPPFMYMELRQPGIRTVVNSVDVLGGTALFTAVTATGKFRNENPKLYAAFLASMKEALAAIAQDKPGAAQLYLRVSKDKDTVENVLAMLNDPNIEFSLTPKNVMKYVDFMYKMQVIKTRAESWKDLFFPEIHGLAGS